MEAESTLVSGDTKFAKSISAHPAVSIGMPVFNCEPWVGKAIESILGQSYEDFELIISDNASTDGTGRICQQYASRDKRITYIRQPKNIGATNNFKYVVEKANGKFFIWAAGDDWWAPDRLEKLVMALKDNVAVVMGSVRRYLDDAAVAEFTPKPFKKGDAYSFILREESRCEKVYYIYGLGRRADFIDAVNAIKDGYGEDAIFCYQLLWRGELAAMPGATLHSVARQSSEGMAMVAGFRYSWVRALYRAHPWSYYRRYLENTPTYQRPKVFGILLVKALVSPFHLWWRAFCRLVLKRPYLHGALPGGPEKILNL